MPIWLSEGTFVTNMRYGRDFYQNMGNMGGFHENMGGNMGNMGNMGGVGSLESAILAENDQNRPKMSKN